MEAGKCSVLSGYSNNIYFLNKIVVLKVRKKKGMDFEEAVVVPATKWVGNNSTSSTDCISEKHFGQFIASNNNNINVY